MKWSVESWRKVYLNKSVSWLRMPVSARGLGRELVTYVDDLGCLDIGDDQPAMAIAYILGARPDEHERIARDVTALMSGNDPYLVHEGTTLRIRNFLSAQDRTPGAKRTSEWRARKQAEEEANLAKKLEKLSAKPAQFGPREASSCASQETSHVTGGDVTPASLGDANCDADVTTDRAVPCRGDLSPKSPLSDGVTGPPPETLPAEAVSGTSPEPEPATHAEPSAAADAPAMLLVVEPTKPKPEDEVFAEYLAGWKRVRGKGTEPVFNDARRKLVRKRMKDFSVEALKAAAAGIWHSEWNVEKNQSSFDLALRDAAHVEQFAAEFEKHAPKARASPKPLDDDAPIHPSLLAKVSADAAAIEKFKQKMLANGSVAQNPSEGS